MDHTDHAIHEARRRPPLSANGAEEAGQQGVENGVEGSVLVERQRDAKIGQLFGYRQSNSGFSPLAFEWMWVIVSWGVAGI